MEKGGQTFQGSSFDAMASITLVAPELNILSIRRYYSPLVDFISVIFNQQLLCSHLQFSLTHITSKTTRIGQSIPNL